MARSTNLPRYHSIQAAGIHLKIGCFCQWHDAKGMSVIDQHFCQKDSNKIPIFRLLILFIQTLVMITIYDALELGEHWLIYYLVVR